MNKDEFLPPPDVVAEIRRELDAHNTARAPVLEAMRRRRQRFVGLVLLAFLAAAVLVRVNFPEIGLLSLPYVFVLVLGVIAVFAADDLAKRPARRLQQQLRDSLFPCIFGFIEDLRYERGVTPQSFARLPASATGSHNRRSFDDVFTGRYRGFPFQLYETTLRHKGRKSSSSTVFRGVILAFQAPKPFAGTLLATKPAGELQRFLRGLFGGGRLERVESGDAALDETYEFRSDNPQAARPLIDGDFTRALDWMREAWPGAPARVALSGDDVFLLLPMDRDFFELPIDAPALDYERHVEPIIADLAAMIATASLVRTAIESH